MDPNSEHQEWSEWVFRIRAPKHPPFQPVIDALRKYTSALIGSHGRLRARQTDKWLEVIIQAETKRDSILDPQWRRHVQNSMTAVVGMLYRTEGTVQWFEPRLLAGNPEDGRPVTQWLILPNIGADIRVFGASLPQPAAQMLGLPGIPSGARVWGG